MTPETRALLREAADFLTEECTSQDAECIHRTLATRLRAAADAGEGEDVTDAARMSWLEDTKLDPFTTTDLVCEWRWNGKRYPTGLRAAIDAAMREAK